MVAYVRFCSYHCKVWHPYCQIRMCTILYIGLSDHLLLSLSTIEVYTASMQPHTCSIPLSCSLHTVITKMYHSCIKIYTFSSICLMCSLAHIFVIYTSLNISELQFLSWLDISSIIPFPSITSKKKKFLIGSPLQDIALMTS